MSLYPNIRLITAIIIIVFMGIGLLYFGVLHEKDHNNQEAYMYYKENFNKDTGIKNAVAAILLSYRMYDTIFEAVIMLCSIIGIMHFLPAVKPKKVSDPKEEKDSDGK